MPRPRKLIPDYKLHKASGQGYCRWSDRNHYFGRHGTPESRKRYAEFVASLPANPLPSSTGDSPAPSTVVPADFTVVEMIDRYILFARTYYVRDGKPTRHLDAIKLALGRVSGTYGLLPARSFGPRCVKQIREQMIQEGCTRTYINGTVDKIRRAFRWGVAEELVPADVYHKLQALGGLKRGRSEAREGKPVLPVADTVVDETLPYLPAVVADMVRFQRLVGCRPGEVCTIRPVDVDRSGEVWSYRPARHKTDYRGRERVVYIGPRAQDVLRPYLLRASEAYCFSPADSEARRLEALHAKRRTPLSCGNRPGSNRKGRRKKPLRTLYSKDSYATAIGRGVIRANKAIAAKAAADGVKDPELLPHWHPNQLRHSAGTEIRRTFGLEAAQVILGHAKADVTQVYAERDARLAVEVVRQIG